MRDPEGQEGATTVSPVPWRQPPTKRVLDIDALAQSFKAATGDAAFTSAQFALQMIEGKDFSASGAKGRRFMVGMMQETSGHAAPRAPPEAAR
jgi:hypothetical protein